MMDWGRTHQLVIQYHMVSPESMITGNMIQIEQVVFRNTHAHVTAVKEKEVINLKESKGVGIWEVWRKKNGKHVITISRSKKKTQEVCVCVLYIYRLNS